MYTQEQSAAVNSISEHLLIEGRPVKTIDGLNVPWGIAINSNGYGGY